MDSYWNDVDGNNHVQNQVKIASSGNFGTCWLQPYFSDRIISRVGGGPQKLDNVLSYESDQK
ncbi:hypothetical protein [uncultured Desulfosarcina sp.]|uniref:hypothetical protein n=1 Tax=uncultured Desulfosarcina sp. TaxID=218289 RepID=UPI0029C971C1|nr:hypothetical protein [uncultured Desulfosarcina sp.]